MQDNIIFTLNGECQKCSDNFNFIQLLESLELEPRSLAIELNREILPKSQWAQTLVKSGDNIEIVQFVGGGL
jgi:sulfur carrier protein